MRQITSSFAIVCLFLASGNLSAETLTRNLTANADWWLANTWLNPAGTAVSWEDYADATLNLNGSTLTLNESAIAGKLTFGNQSGTFASAEGAVLTLTDPVIQMGTSAIPAFKASLALAPGAGGIVSVNGIGNAAAGGNGTNTTFDPASSDDSITAFRLTSGVFDFIEGSAFNGKPIILAGGGLVQTQSSYKSYTNPIIVETSPAYLRVYSSSYMTVKGALSNLDPQVPVELHHTDGGYIFIGCDLSAFFGTLVEASSGTLCFNVTGMTTLHPGISLRVTSGKIQFEPGDTRTVPCTITGNRDIEQSGGSGNAASTIIFSGSYVTESSFYTIKKGTLQLTGEMGGVKTASGATLTGNGIVSREAVVENGGTIRVNPLSIAKLTLQSGAILETSTEEPLALSELSFAGTATVNIPAGLSATSSFALFTLPTGTEADLSKLSIAAGYSIETTELGENRTLYSLIKEKPSLTRTLAESETWENPGAAKWINESGNTVAWADDSNAILYLGRNTLTLTQSAATGSLSVYDGLAASSAAKGTLTSTGDAVLTLNTPSITLGTSGGTGTTTFPTITAALNIALAEGQPQPLSVVAKTGDATTGERFAQFLPASLSGASHVRLSGGGFLVSSEDFPASVPVVVDNATLIATSTYTHDAAAPLIFSGTSNLRCYSNRTLTLKGAIQSEGSEVKINFADSGGHTFAGDMTGFTGTIRNTTSRTVAIHSDATVPSTVTLDASGTSGTIALAIDSDMTLPATLMGGGTMTKTGSGALTLTGALASRTGKFNLNEGRLIIANAYTTTGALTAAGDTELTVTGTLAAPTTVEAGATLTGSGTISGALTIASGATIEPGATIPALTIPGGTTIRLAEGGDPFTATTLALNATTENPIIIAPPAAGRQIISYPLFLLPSTETVDASLLALRDTSRLDSEAVDGGQTLWFIRDGNRGLLISFY